MIKPNQMLKVKWTPSNKKHYIDYLIYTNNFIKILKTKDIQE